MIRYITLVTPAYKEQDRLPKMLDETIEYLKSRAAKDKKVQSSHVRGIPV